MLEIPVQYQATKQKHKGQPPQLMQTTSNDWCYHPMPDQLPEKNEEKSKFQCNLLSSICVMHISVHILESAS